MIQVVRVRGGYDPEHVSWRQVLTRESEMYTSILARKKQAEASSLFAEGRRKRFSYGHDHTRVVSHGHVYMFTVSP